MLVWGSVDGCRDLTSGWCTCILNPKPQTLNPPQTLIPNPQTLNSHPACLGRSHPLLGWSDTEDTRQPLHSYRVKTMESGRIEPLRAPPVHREAQPCSSHPSGPNFPLDGNTLNLTVKALRPHIFSHLPGRPGPRLQQIGTGPLEEGAWTPEVCGGPWRPLEGLGAPGGSESLAGGPWRRLEAEDYLFEVGIEKQQEVIRVVACDVSQRVGVLKKGQFGWLLGQHQRSSLCAGYAAIHRSLEVGWRHRRMDTQPCAGRRPHP